jgi:hypothetical protein
VGETTTSVLVVGAPTMMAASRHPVEQGQTPPPVGHRHRSDEFLTLCWRLSGLASCHNTGLYLLIDVGLCLLQMHWLSSCRSTSSLGRSWTAGKASLPCGRTGWWLQRALLERCAQNCDAVGHWLVLCLKLFLLPLTLPAIC